MTSVHLVGSIALDTAQEVFATVGELLGPHIKRCPDGEPGGRRLWISWQYPLLRSSPYLKFDGSKLIPDVGFCFLRIANGVKPEEIRFGELGYAREARASYQDFLTARERGVLPAHARFQVSLPTPFAVIGPFVVPEDMAAVEKAYEEAMLREVKAICAAIPHQDLAMQWDVCIEMVAWDGCWPLMRPFLGMDKVFAGKFARLSAAVPADVELGYHLCYGDLDAKHFVEPQDTGKAAEFANFLADNVKHAINWIHLPVPIDRDDDAYFAPLRQLRRGTGTDLYLGLVHLRDGASGALRRMAAAAKVVSDFGIATECGMGRAKTSAMVRELLRIHAEAAKAGAAAG